MKLLARTLERIIRFQHRMLFTKYKKTNVYESRTRQADKQIREELFLHQFFRTFVSAMILLLMSLTLAELLFIPFSWRRRALSLNVDTQFCRFIGRHDSIFSWLTWQKETQSKSAHNWRRIRHTLENVTEEERNKKNKKKTRKEEHFSASMLFTVVLLAIRWWWKLYTWITNKE